MKDSYSFTETRQAPMYLGEKQKFHTVANSIFSITILSGLVFETKDNAAYDATNMVSPLGNLEGQHLQNFAEAIRGNEGVYAPIAEGHKSTLLPQLGNIAYRLRRTLKCNPSNGHILDDAEAMKLWAREYEKGWAPGI